MRIAPWQYKNVNVLRNKHEVEDLQEFYGGIDEAVDRVGEQFLRMSH